MLRSFPLVFLCSGVVLLASLVRAFYHRWRRHTRPTRVVLLGANAMASHLAAVLTHTPVARYIVQGCVSAGEARAMSDEADDPKVLGSLSALPEILAQYHPDLLVVALPDGPRPMAWTTLLSVPTPAVQIIEGATLYEQLTGQVFLHPLWTPRVPSYTRQRGQDVAKRLTDLILATASLGVALPLMALVTFALKLSSRGPVFFRQERVGQDGHTFTLVKFRTMVPDAEKLTGPVWSQERDPRVTRLGHFLRRTGLDEIPQLFSILRGHMSLVGPRPERPYFVRQLTQQLPGYGQRLSVKPGLTGWAQVSYGYGANLEDAQEKLGFDLYYIKHRSFLMDLWIILRTVPKVLGARVAMRAPVTSMVPRCPRATSTVV